MPACAALLMLNQIRTAQLGSNSSSFTAAYERTLHLTLPNWLEPWRCLYGGKFVLPSRTVCSPARLAAGPANRHFSGLGPARGKIQASLARPVGPPGRRAPYKINICTNSPSRQLPASTGFRRGKFGNCHPLGKKTGGGPVGLGFAGPSLMVGLQPCAAPTVARSESSPMAKRRQLSSGRRSQAKAGSHPRTLCHFAAGDRKCGSQESEAHGPSYRRRIPVRAWGDRHDHRADICAVQGGPPVDRIDAIHSHNTAFPSLAF